jgi:DNA-binding transcriptional MocR family regulator
MIESGTFQPGEKLPSVRELCDSFNVGRSAVRDAISTLSGEGKNKVRAHLFVSLIPFSYFLNKVFYLMQKISKSYFKSEKY